MVRNRARSWAETLLRRRHQAEFELILAKCRHAEPRAGYHRHRTAAFKVLRNTYRFEFARLMDTAMRLVTEQEGIKDGRLSKHPAAVYPCPKCGVEANAGCRTTGGLSTHMHAARRALLNVETTELATASS